MPRIGSVSSTTRLVLAAVTALGAALRLHGLDAQSLWNDELGAIANSTSGTIGHAFWLGFDPEHPPAYYMSLRLWLTLAGDSAVAARLPSALCGILTVPAMFALGRRWFGATEGLIAAALTAVAHVPIYFSQEARVYAVLLLAVTLSTAWLTDVMAALRSGERPPRAALFGFVLATIVASQAHFFGTLFVVLQAGGAALSAWPGWRAIGRLAAAYAVVAVAFLPCFYRLLHVPPSTPTWLSAPSASAPWGLVRYLFNDSTALAVAAVLLWALAAGRGARAPRAAGATWLAFGWLVVPVVIAFAFSHLVRPAFVARALIIVAPAAYLLAARGLVATALPRPLLAALTTALVAALLLDLVAGRRYYTRPVKAQFREAARYLVAHDDGRPATVLACSWNRRYFDYYLRRLGSPRRVDAVIRSPPEAAEQARRVAAQPPEQLWLLAGHLDCSADLLAALRAALRPLDEQHFVQAGVWRFTRRD